MSLHVRCICLSFSTCLTKRLVNWEKVKTHFTWAVMFMSMPGIGLLPNTSNSPSHTHGRKIHKLFLIDCIHDGHISTDNLIQNGKETGFRFPVTSCQTRCQLHGISCLQEQCTANTTTQDGHYIPEQWPSWNRTLNSWRPQQPDISTWI